MIKNSDEEFYVSENSQDSSSFFVNFSAELLKNETKCDKISFRALNCIEDGEFFVDL